MSDVIVVLVLLAALAILLRMNVIFYLVYVGVGTYALARWSTERNLKGVRIRRKLVDHLFLGQELSIRIEVENTRWWPVPWLQLEEAVPLSLQSGPVLREVVSLRPKEKLDLAYTIAARQRGYYPIGPLRVGTGDLFGFARAKGRVLAEDRIFVYPRVIPLAKAAFESRAPYGTIRSRQRIFADPTRAGGVREYHPGDPLRTVDWKSSAHSGALQVRKYDPAVSLATVIFLNLRAQEYTRQLRGQASEWAIVVAASLANHLAGQRQNVGLASNGADVLTGARDWLLPPRNGRAHLMKLLEWLARVQLVESDRPFADWLPTAALDLAWGTLAVVVTPAGDEVTCQALHRLVRAGLNPVLLMVEPHYRLGAAGERARRLGFRAAMAADEHDLARL